MSFLLSGRRVDAIPDSVVEQFNAQEAFSSADEGTTIAEWSGELEAYSATGGSPTVVGSGINGYRSLEWDAVDDYLSIDDGTWADISQPFTIIAVVEPFFSSSAGTFYGVVDEAGNDGSRVRLQWHDSDNWLLAADSASSGLAGSNDTNVRLLTAVADGSNSELREDGSQAATGSFGDESLVSVSIGSFQSGSGDIWDGYIGLIEIHDGLPSNGLETREQEIADMWGITL